MAPQVTRLTSEELAALEELSKATKTAAQFLVFARKALDAFPSLLAEVREGRERAKLLEAVRAP